MTAGSPNLARQLVDDGNAAMRQERYDTALAKYRQALKLIPGHPGILNNCAVVLEKLNRLEDCLLYTSPSPRDQRGSRMPSSA